MMMMNWITVFLLLLSPRSSAIDSSGPLILSSKDKSLHFSKIRSPSPRKEGPAYLSVETDPKDKEIPSAHRILSPLVMLTDDGVSITEEKSGYIFGDMDLAQDDHTSTFQTIPEMICSLCSQLHRPSRRLVCSNLFCFDWERK